MKVTHIFNITGVSFSFTGVSSPPSGARFKAFASACLVNHGIRLPSPDKEHGPKALQCPLVSYQNSPNFHSLHQGPIYKRKGWSRRSHDFSGVSCSFSGGVESSATQVISNCYYKSCSIPIIHFVDGLFAAFGSMLVREW